jgi:hypothetical protein
VSARAREQVTVVLLRALRRDHGHTTANEAQACRTCSRRAGILTAALVEADLVQESGLVLTDSEVACGGKTVALMHDGDLETRVCTLPTGHNGNHRQRGEYEWTR